MLAISVIIPTCDRPDRLAAALQSVRSQTLQPAEIIVVDDGTSGLGAPPEAAITVVRGVGAAGPSASRNLGVDHANGDFVAFLDDDDRWSEEYLEEVTKALTGSAPEADVAICRLRFERNDGSFQSADMPHIEDLEAALLSANPGFGGSNIVVRRSFFHRTGGFNEKFLNSNDRDFGLRAVGSGARFILVPDAVAIANTGGHERISVGLRSVWRKLPFVLHYWRRMNREQRASNIGRLRRMTRKAIKARISLSIAAVRAPLGKAKRAFSMSRSIGRRR